MKSISIKLWLVIIGFALLILTLAIFAGSILVKNYYYNLITAKMVEEGKAIGTLYYQAEDRDEFLRQVEQLNSVLEEDIIVTSNSKLLAGCIPFEQASSDMLITAEERSRLVRGEVVIHRGFHPRFGKRILAVAVPLFRDGRMVGAVFLSSPLATVSEIVGQVQHLVAYGGILAIIAAVFIGFLISRGLSGPLVRMQLTAEKMAAGDFRNLLEVRSQDEIGRLSQSLNHLSKVLAEQEQLRRDFVANASHELRTPLSFLQGYSEILLDGVDDLQDKKEYLTIILQETKRLRRLVDDLLELSQLEAGLPKVKTAVDWEGLVERVTGNLAPLAQEKGIVLVRRTPSGLPAVWGNEDQLERVLLNLLDNALRFTSPGGKIEVQVVHRKGFLLTQVIDNGVGNTGEIFA
ncbi:MAG: histidine kinase dimerization/phospho-acceptor domain-containing protein [Thermincola sp.]|jgi:signal transduction histidine kinase|nr:histidine kinase dimerization/phospho-acceptor domain-containing protein [Thermincola sp.]MDT3702272.1 histidine kinase dimerization/phospho-acceptor domain-containing protein [Thermincola sp.]